MSYMEQQEVEGVSTLSESVDATTARTDKEVMALVLRQEEIRARSAAEQRTHELTMQQLEMVRVREEREFELRRLKLQANIQGQHAPTPVNEEQSGGTSSNYKGPALPKFKEGDDVDTYL